MFKWQWMLCFLAATAWADQATDRYGKPCEETVDLAEQGQFHRLHFECGKAALADEADAGDAAGAIAVSADPAAQSAGQARSPVTVPASAGVVDHQVISAPQASWQGVAQLQDSLFQAMARQCPAGWRKLGEWVSQDPAGYRLHYSYSCL